MTDQMTLNHPTHQARVKLATWMMNEKRQFPKFLAETFTQHVDTVSRPSMKVFSEGEGSSALSISPMKHQVFVSEYMSRKTPYRGLLLYHGLGSGKTGSSIMIAEGYLGKQVVVLLPASLRPNYEQEILKKFGNSAFREQYHWQFVPVDYDGTPNSDAESLMQVKGMPTSVLRKLFDDFQTTPVEKKEKSVGTVVKIRHTVSETISNTNLRVQRETGEFAIIEDILRQDGDKHFRVRNLNDPIGTTSVVVDSAVEVAFGVFMMDVNKNPNFSTMSRVHKKLLQRQIKLMYQYKYIFIHYNAGATFWGNIFQTLLSPTVLRQATTKLFGSENMFRKNLPSKERHRRDLSILNYIFDPTNSCPNPFDDKVVIVDEIHNCSSQMSGGGLVLPLLYETLLRANCKLVFLSGTPAINKPFELALIFNLLRGYVRTLTLSLSKVEGRWNTDTLQKILTAIPFIQRFHINSKNKTVELIQHQNNFVNQYDRRGKLIGIHKATDELMIQKPATKAEFVQHVSTVLEKYKYTVNLDTPVVESNYTMFSDNLIQPKTASKYPHIHTGHIHAVHRSRKQTTNVSEDVGEDQFSTKFIDGVEFKIKSHMVEEFQRKILGLVSHFNEVSGNDADTGSPIFPSVEYAGPEDTQVEMSEHQFQVYDDMREREHEMDLAKQRRAQVQSGRDDLTNLHGDKGHFRIFSRRAGLFVFPPKLQKLREKVKDTRKNPAWKLNVRKEAELLVQKISQLCKLDTTNPDNADSIASLKQFASTVSKKKVRTLINKVDYILGGNLSTQSNQQLRQSVDRLCRLSNIEDILQEIVVNDDSSSSSDEDVALDIQAIVERLTVENLKPNGNTFYNLSVLSPKYCRILQHTEMSGGPVMVYSQFLRTEGLHLLGKVLHSNGFTRLTFTQERGSKTFTVVPAKTTDYYIGQKVRFCQDKQQHIWTTGTVSRKMIGQHGSTTHYQVQDSSGSILLERVEESELFPACFAEWSGAVNKMQRNAILDYFNHQDNKFGCLCSVLLVTKAGSEGISLFNVRQVHLLEPYWNETRREQVIGRARRIKSHVHLPREQQTVKVFNYCIVLPGSFREGVWGQFSIIREVIEKKCKPLLNELDSSFDINLFIKTQIVDRFASNTLDFERVAQSILSSNGTPENTVVPMARVIMNALQELARQKNLVITASILDPSRLTKGLVQGIQLWARKSERVSERDEYLTSDEVLQDIGRKKSSILKSFYTAIKGVAIDCEFNKDQNVSSNPSEYSSLNCLNTIVDNHNNEYAFQLENPEFIPVSSANSRAAVEQREDVYSLLYYKPQNLSFLVRLPSRFSNVQDYCRSMSTTSTTTPPELDLIDYYVYYGLSLLEPTQSYSKVKKKIGKLVCGHNNQQFSIELKQDFTHNMAYYQKIQSCIEELGQRIPEDGMVEQWRTSILKLVERTGESVEVENSSDEEEDESSFETL